jgi:hypothetical protein
MADKKRSGQKCSAIQPEGESAMKTVTVYMTCATDSDKQSLQFFDEEEVRGFGGVKSLESRIRKDSFWFSAIGNLQVPDGTSGPEDSQFPQQSLATLIEAWRQKGAFVTVGAAHIDARRCKTGQLVRLLVYVTCDQSTYEEFTFIPEAEVEAGGSVEEYEAMLRERLAWYYPLGALEVVAANGGIEMPVGPIMELNAAWEKKGSPKIPGKFHPDNRKPGQNTVM